MAIRGLHHIAMKAVDFEAAKAFYTETMGFETIGNLGAVVFIDIGGSTIELSAAAEGVETQCTPACGMLHLAWEVDDVEETANELKAKGVEFFIEPKAVSDDLTIAFFRDPDGNELELFKSKTLTWK